MQIYDLATLAQPVIQSVPVSTSYQNILLTAPPRTETSALLVTRLTLDDSRFQTSSGRHAASINVLAASASYHASTATQTRSSPGNTVQVPPAQPASPTMTVNPGCYRHTRKFLDPAALHRHRQQVQKTQGSLSPRLAALAHKAAAAALPKTVSNGI